MPDYQKSKIYRVVCSETGKQYIGSTVQPLYKRLHQHKTKNNFCSSNSLINPEIFLIENVCCNSKEELLSIERKFIETMDCINKRVPNRTKKQHYKDNKEEINKKAKEYHYLNKEKILERKKNFYYDNNYMVKCNCGKQITKNALTKHKKTKKHIDRMNLL